MPDEEGMVRGDEFKTWGILGRPPDRLMMASPELIRRWKKLHEDAVKVRKLRGPSRRKRAKEIEARYASLVREIELNVRLLQGR
jgi:hypothetical protein